MLVDACLTDLVAMKHEQNENNLAFRFKDYRNSKTQNYVHVLVNNSDRGFMRRRGWIETFLRIKGSKEEQPEYKSIRRTTLEFLRTDESAVLAALRYQSA